MKHSLKPITGLALLGLLNACAPVNLLNAITPSSTFTKAKNISYGGLERQSLDVYSPKDPKSGAPVLVFTHGGSWDSGNKDIYKFFAEGFTLEGYSVVVPNYRLYPDARFPDMIIDTAMAIHYASERFPDRPIVAMGHSAGGYNTLMALQVPEFSEQAELDVCGRVAGVVAFAPPTGIIPLKEEPFITIFPDRFTGEDAPLNNTSTPLPPIFFVHGSDDTTVYPQNSQKLADAIIQRGGKAKVKVYEGLNHIDVIKNISRHFDGEDGLKRNIISFINSLDTQSQNYCD